MSAVDIISGIYVSDAPEYRESLPRNLVVVPLAQGISKGYLRSHDGIVTIGTGPGIVRAGINWQGTEYRIMGSSLVTVAVDGSTTVLGDVGDDGKPATLDYSFDRLAIASAGALFYWDGSSLTQVVDTDLGTVLDVLYVGGYFMTTDGVDLVTTDIDDPMSVNPLHYGSSEADPDPVVGLQLLRNEVYAFNRYTTEVFQNVGGSTFPFQVVESALVPRGAIGTHAICEFAQTFAFLGSGRNESPSIYLLASGTSTPIASREVNQVLQQYTEAQLSMVKLEARVDKSHNHLYVHLPDRTLLYDIAATQVLSRPVWTELASTVDGYGEFRARHFVWCYDRWNVGDPTSSSLGHFQSGVATHFDSIAGWQFQTQFGFNNTNGAVVHELELVGLPGYAPSGIDPTIWTSYSIDGTTWSQERPRSAGKRGQTQKRLAWRSQGSFALQRIQRFRGADEAPVAFSRLELTAEALFN